MFELLYQYRHILSVVLLTAVFIGGLIWQKVVQKRHLRRMAQDVKRRYS